MKTTEKMNDAQRKEAWGAVETPFEALEELSAHAAYLGGDPYYNDIVDALLGMVGRVLERGDPVAKLRDAWTVRDLVSDDFDGAGEAGPDAQDLLKAMREIANGKTAGTPEAEIVRIDRLACDAIDRAEGKQ